MCDLIGSAKILAAFDQCLGGGDLLATVQGGGGWSPCYCASYDCAMKLELQRDVLNPEVSFLQEACNDKDKKAAVVRTSSKPQSGIYVCIS